MRILQVFDFLSLPHGGGTVDIVYKLSRALAKKGHEVTICTGDYEVDYKYLSGLGVVGLKLYHSYFNKHGIYLMPDLLNLDVCKYDLIHLHCYRSIQNIILTKKATRYKIPYLVDAHGSTVSRTGSKTLLLGAYDRLAGKQQIKNARFVIAETEIGVAEWERLGAHKNQIRIQHPLLDTSEFNMLPERGSFRKWYKINDSPMILFLGRVHSAKGIDTLLYAFRSIARNRDAVFVIAGRDDGYKAKLEELICRMNIMSKVRFVGYLEGNRKLAALVDANVLIQPSRNEAGARPSLEAIMCNTPAIVSRNTGAGREIAKFDGGLLFGSGDAKELAGAIQQTIDNPGDAKTRTARAREYIVENLSLEKQVQRYEKLYQEAVK